MLEQSDQLLQRVICKRRREKISDDMDDAVKCYDNDKEESVLVLGEVRGKSKPFKGAQ